MSAKEIEAALANGVEVLEKFLPLKTYLYFPLLYSACVWAARRIFDYRERILAWQVWIDPDYVKVKPDAFVLHFFTTNPALGRAYAGEIAAADMKALRTAFAALYPVCGLEDAFLKGLFREELDKNDYRALAAGFKKRAAAARDAVVAASGNHGFWRALEEFGVDIAALGIHLLGDDKVKTMILAALEDAEPDGAGVA